MTTVIANGAVGQKFTSNAGISPAWVAQVADAVMTNVVVQGSHAKAQSQLLHNGDVLEVNTDTGSGELTVSFTAGGPFQKYHLCTSLTVNRGSTATLMYYVPNVHTPSVHYGWKVNGAGPIDLGEAVLGQTIG
jgi:hypothetical protein